MDFGSVFRGADILLPRDGDMEKWSVVACDQFTYEPSYWERVGERVGHSPSTFHMILPEAWLPETDLEAAAGRINGGMADYLKTGIFREIYDSYIYVERCLPDGRVRRGLVGALDLEAYEFTPQSAAPVRASEDTVLSRLPARVKMRRGAPLELPHVMVLIDDPERAIIEPLGDEKGEMERLYNFTLMEGGGRVSGYRVAHKPTLSLGGIMIVGDGNHSLAAAKICWDKIKGELRESERRAHPARYALAELVNIHDDSLVIEPIHRIVYGAGGGLADAFVSACPNAAKGGGDGYKIGYAAGDDTGEITVKDLTIGETIGALQDFLDGYVNKNGGEIDYIHGDSDLRRLVKQKDSTGFFMPAIEKCDIFQSVASGGVFPKKSFSIGSAREKRYYLECRRIR